MFRKLVVASLMLGTSLTAAQARTTVTWWHAMGGELGQKLEEIVANYNKSPGQIRGRPGLQGLLSPRP